MTTTDQGAVTVAQVDRDEAHAIAVAWDAGRYDEAGQLVARHRLASVSSASADCVLVPREPTEAMLEAMHRDIRIKVEPSLKTADIMNEREVWAAMLAASPEPVLATNQAGEVDIKGMVSRFLAWKLPSDFHPDAGITFKAAFNEHTEHPMKHEPTGTNLFTAAQAEVMIRHLIDQPSPMKMVVNQDWLDAKIATDPDADCEAGAFSPEWCLNMAALEGNAEIGAGSLDHPLRTASFATQPATSQEVERLCNAIDKELSGVISPDNRGALLKQARDLLATQPATSPCPDCKGTGYSGGVVPVEPELCDACETCFGEGVTSQPATSQEGEDELRAAFLAWRKAVARHDGFLVEGRDVTSGAVRRSGQRCASTYSALADLAVKALPRLIAAAPTPPTLSEDLREALEALERQAVALYRAATPAGNYGANTEGSDANQNAFADKDPSVIKARAALAQVKAS